MELDERSVNQLLTPVRVLMHVSEAPSQASPLNTIRMTTPDPQWVPSVLKQVPKPLPASSIPPAFVIRRHKYNPRPSSRQRPPLLA